MTKKTAQKNSAERIQARVERLQNRVLKKAQALPAPVQPEQVFDLLEQYNDTFLLTGYQRNKIIKNVCLATGFSLNGDANQFNFYYMDYDRFDDIRVMTNKATGEKTYEWVSFTGRLTRIDLKDKDDRDYIEFLTGDTDSTYRLIHQYENEVNRFDYYSKHKFRKVGVTVPEYFIQVMGDLGLTAEAVLEQFVNDLMENSNSQGSDERMLAQGWLRRGNISHAMLEPEEAEKVMDFYGFDYARF